MDSPRVEPMTTALAMGYIDEELQQLQTDYVDLLLFHHRCRTTAETAAVWRAFEDAKSSGKARHIGVSNFNKHDLETLQRTVRQPIEVLEAHFGVGIMDFEVLEYARAHDIHLVGFAELSELSTNHPTIQTTVANVAAAHGLSNAQVMYNYNRQHGLTVLSSCFHPDDPARCARYYAKDLEVFDVTFSEEEMHALDSVTAGKRTCTDCFTDECQACANRLKTMGCPIEPRPYPVWGRSNPQGVECLACAAQANHQAGVMAACGRTGAGESLETMVPKACGI